MKPRLKPDHNRTQLSKSRLEAETLREALDRMSEAVAMISRIGRVAYANRAAQRIFDKGTGVTVSRDGQLVTATKDARDTLARALARGTGLAPVAVRSND
jgi:PAS domain-containing protein